jgi:hypothetical protein
MAKKRTWLWILGGLFLLCVIALIAIAGAGMYFISQHIDTARTSGDDAQRAFETARRPYKEPLFELDRFERVQLRRPLRELPTSTTRPQHLWILAWDPDDERLVKVSLPFWLLKMGRRNIDIGTNGHGGFQLEQLDLDMHELERIGPALIVDHRAPSGARVLIWTQ